MFEIGTGVATSCRTVVVPECDNDLPLDAPADALHTFRLCLRDQLDFTVDFRAWMQANGGTSMTSCIFTVSLLSPKVPTIVSQDASPAGQATIVLGVPQGGVPGDAYKLDVTANFSAKAAAGADDLDVGARRIVRRIDVLVVPG